MNRLIIALLGGALAGAVLTYVLLGPDTVQVPAEIVRDIVVVEKMTPAAADEHRVDRYAALQTVEQIYALMRRDPARALELIERSDLPENERQQLETMFEQIN